METKTVNCEHSIIKLCNLASNQSICQDLRRLFVIIVRQQYNITLQQLQWSVAFAKL